VATSNINRVVLTGNLKRDLVLRNTNSGTPVYGLRIASNTRRKTSGGEWVDKPNYLNVTVWGAPGENCHRFLAKGRPVAIDGNDSTVGVQRRSQLGQRYARTSPRGSRLGVTLQTAASSRAPHVRVSHSPAVSDLAPVESEVEVRTAAWELSFLVRAGDPAGESRSRERGTRFCSARGLVGDHCDTDAGRDQASEQHRERDAPAASPARAEQLETLLRAHAGKGGVFTSPVCYTRPLRLRTNGKAESLVEALLRAWVYRFAYATSSHRVRALPGHLRWYNSTDRTAHSAADRRSAVSRRSVGLTASPRRPGTPPRERCGPARCWSCSPCLLSGRHPVHRRSRGHRCTGW
jgi:single stranded DNA-binding protein